VVAFVQKHDNWREKQNAHYEPNNSVNARQVGRWLKHKHRGANLHKLHPAAYRLYGNECTFFARLRADEQIKMMIGKLVMKKRQLFNLSFRGIELTAEQWDLRWVKRRVLMIEFHS